MVPMRDGVGLAMDVRLPAGDGPHPVVLIRTMYDKVEQRDALVDPARGIPYDGAFVEALLSAGYALAVQDVRGRFDSDGEWHPYINERRDGFDSVEWVYEQPWCDGNIGMIGRSYVGYTQWMAAADRPRGSRRSCPSARRSSRTTATRSSTASSCSRWPSSGSRADGTASRSATSCAT